MPLSIVGVYENGAVIILTARSDPGHGVEVEWNHRDVGVPKRAVSRE